VSVFVCKVRKTHRKSSSFFDHRGIKSLKFASCRLRKASTSAKKRLIEPFSQPALKMELEILIAVVTAQLPFLTPPGYMIIRIGSPGKA
jgi:hypothetical protein